ncbi:hypothetical protein TRAPUB_2839 [Trametes pubescens]|uniref:Protein kinase domain-containing protein n=1 Tax=Trametes pubescens TaxID=154538 RepID=A0A1M2VFK0_TRAPU|nr:hypothetical protein TRAPUB_2839 [Trametes pubescens]
MPKPLGPEHGKTDPKIIVAAAQQKSNSLSAAAAPSQLHITQTPAHPDAIYDGRPWSLLGVPLTIYCKAFTEFRVTMANDSLEFDLAELTCARKLVSAAVQHVPTKYERIEALAALKQAVHADILTMEVMRLPNEIMPGGRICASSHFDFIFPILCLTEVKMEIGANSCDPMDQAKQDYRAIYRSEKYKPVRDASCCPCLLVAIAGPNIMVGGAVYVEQIIAASFTHYICIAPHDVDGPRSSYDAAIWRTAQLIHALKQATVALEDYYTAVTKTMDAVPAAEKLYVGPHLTQVSAADGTEISLVYTGRLCIDEPAKAIYSAHAHVAGASATADVVVKFTKAYSAEGHRLLAAHAFAPKLWFCEWVESVDMYVVVMEHIRDAETADEDVAMSAADAAAVRTAVELLHAAGLVFGDLRGPNVLLRKDGGPLLIDFDWCGPEGTACYPLGVNMHSAIPWHPDVNTGTLIKKEHDWHLLKMLTGS